MNEAVSLPQLAGWPESSPALASGCWVGPSLGTDARWEDHDGTCPSGHVVERPSVWLRQCLYLQDKPTAIPASQDLQVSFTQAPIKLLLLLGP